jgi:hypothetical protein
MPGFVRESPASCDYSQPVQVRIPVAPATASATWMPNGVAAAPS